MYSSLVVVLVVALVPRCRRTAYPHPLHHFELAVVSFAPPSELAAHLVASIHAQMHYLGLLVTATMLAGASASCDSGVNDCSRCVQLRGSMSSDRCQYCPTTGACSTEAFATCDQGVFCSQERGSCSHMTSWGRDLGWWIPSIAGCRELGDFRCKAPTGSASARRKPTRRCRRRSP